MGAPPLDIAELVSAPRPPWQNAYVERLIGSIRRECTDHIIPMGEAHLLRTVREYAQYYRTSEESLDVIRKMGVRYGDGDIARVLNKWDRVTGEGHPWSQQSVKSARRNHKIEGRAKTIDDPEILTLQGAARYTATSDTSIKKLVDAGVLPMHRVVPYAPWEIRLGDLDSTRVRGILDTLKRTGRLRLGVKSITQEALFPSKQSETKE